MDTTKMGDMIGKMGDMIGVVAPIIVYIAIGVIIFGILKKRFFGK